MGRLPMFINPRALASLPGGSTGQACLFGYAAPRLGESAGVQSRPAFTPPWHLPVVVLQIGHGWMSVKSFTHAAPPHSTELGAGVRHRRPSLLHRKGSRSPVRKMVEVRGAFRTLVSPVLHDPMPVAFSANELMTQVLRFACDAFGIGRGGPNKQSLVVHRRSGWVPPTSAGAAPIMLSVVPLQHTVLTDDPMSGTTAGSGTALCPPPKKRFPQVRFPSEQKPPGQSVMTVHSMSALVPPTHVLGRTVPPASLTLPQMPVPVPVVKVIFDGVPPAQLQAAAASSWQRPLQICPAGAAPHGGSHCSPLSTTPLPHTEAKVVVVVVATVVVVVAANEVVVVAVVLVVGVGPPVVLVTVDVVVTEIAVTSCAMPGRAM